MYDLRCVWVPSSQPSDFLFFAHSGLVEGNQQLLLQVVSLEYPQEVAAAPSEAYGHHIDASQTQVCALR